MTTYKSHPVNAILFDLDGTLFDTAADLTSAANALISLRGGVAVPLSEMRPFIAKGTRGMLGKSFGIDERHADFQALSQDFLKAYEERMLCETCFFSDMDLVLDFLDQRRLPWGIVTNKPTQLAQALLSHFKLTDRARCLVAGDTLPRRKPDPDQLLYACELLNFKPENVWYVGDTEEDVIAAKRAGMKIALVQHGYLQPGDNPTSWGVDFLISHPSEIIALLEV